MGTDLTVVELIAFAWGSGIVLQWIIDGISDLWAAWFSVVREF